MIYHVNLSREELDLLIDLLPEHAQDDFLEFHYSHEGAEEAWELQKKLLSVRGEVEEKR